MRRNKFPTGLLLTAIRRLGLTVCLLAGMSHAQPSFVVQSVQIKMGAELPMLRPNSLFAVGMEGEFLAGRSPLHLLPYFEYSAGKWQEGKEEWQWRLWAVGVSAAHFVVNRHARSTPFWGGGFGFHYGYGEMSGRTDASSRSAAPEAELDLALNLLAGVRIPLSPAASGSLMCRYSLTGKTDNVAIWFGALMNLNGAKQ